MIILAMSKNSLDSEGKFVLIMINFRKLREIYENFPKA